MARKTFISYKYLDSKNRRNQVLESLGDDASYYRGETSESPNLDDLKTETIKSRLSDMIFDTGVMIVIISENIDKSKWVEWEVNYATSTQTRKGRKSHPNGIVLVIPDELIDSENKYITTNIDRLLEEKNVAGIVTRRFSSFLKNPDMAIEEAYNNRTRNY